MPTTSTKTIDHDHPLNGRYVAVLDNRGAWHFGVLLNVATITDRKKRTHINAVIQPYHRDPETQPIAVDTELNDIEPWYPAVTHPPHHHPNQHQTATPAA